LIRLRAAIWVEPTVTLSIAVKVGVMVRAVFKTAVRVSVPAPPFSTSVEPKVCVAETREPSNESAPAVPVKLFVPVVSGQV
jgi:hypothetical protein